MGSTRANMSARRAVLSYHFRDKDGRTRRRPED
jgi:hypothetical protein